MTILLAVEDAPTEQIVRKCLSIVNPNIEITGVLTKRGISHLYTRRNELNTSARQMQILLLIDLDNPNICPPQIRARWFPRGLSTGLMFRIAVVEVEAWLLASRTELARYFRVSAALIPLGVEQIGDPKQHLINLARRSPDREKRSDIVPENGSTAKIGRNYNGRLAAFISNDWNMHEAAANSPSLLKLVNSLSQLR